MKFVTIRIPCLIILGQIQAHNGRALRGTGFYHLQAPVSQRNPQVKIDVEQLEVDGSINHILKQLLNW
jgi:hypothetical protein